MAHNAYSNIMNTISKLFLSLLVGIIVLSCSNKEVILRSTDKASINHNVSLKNVRQYITDIKGFQPTKADAVSIEPIIIGADTVMFLVNYDNGWEVLSGDTRASVVLMKSDAGNISANDLHATPESSVFFQRISEGLASILHNPSFTTPDCFNDSWEDFFPIDSIPPLNPVCDTVLLSIDTLSISTVKCQDHLMSTKWGQGTPWNQYAPYTDYTMVSHCVTGCVPVAISQVLYYLHNKIGVPISTYGSANCTAYVPSGNDNPYVVLSDANVSFSDYSSNHWSSMALNQTSSDNFATVSALMVRLGYLFEARYRATSTGVLNSVLDNSAVSILSNNFAISSSISDYSWITTPQDIEEQIYDNELPVLMGIRRVVSENPTTYAGHYVVLDGYKVVNYSLRYNYVIHNSLRPDALFSEEYLVPSTFVAINWGWNGLFDSTNGNTNWFNLFDCWLVGNQNTTLNYSIKDHYIYDFAPINS